MEIISFSLLVISHIIVIYTCCIKILELSVLEVFVNEVEKQFDRKIKVVKYYRGGDF